MLLIEVKQVNLVFLQIRLIINWKIDL
jgi:hypothetical protein